MGRKDLNVDLTFLLLPILFPLLAQLCPFFYSLSRASELNDMITNRELLDGLLCTAVVVLDADADIWAVGR